MKNINIKLIHTYLAFDRDPDYLIESSVEINNNNILKIIHKYMKDGQIKIAESTKELDNSIIDEIRKINVDEYQNNYLNDDKLAARWTLIYNDKTITGTYDNQIIPYTDLKRILEFDKIINEADINEKFL